MCCCMNLLCECFSHKAVFYGPILKEWTVRVFGFDNIKAVASKH